MNVQLVVCDMAGTTVEDGDAVLHCLTDALQRAGVKASRAQINAVMGLPKPEALRQVLAQTGRAPSAAQVAAIHDDFLAQMLLFYRTAPGLQEVPGTSQAFHILRSAGVRIALDTGFSRPIAEAILERLPWRREGLLDVTVTSDEVGRGRPYPDMILQAMSATGVTDPQRVAKVGDTPADLQQGLAAGCGWVIGVTSGSHTAADLWGCPHTHLIPSIADLPGVLSEHPRSVSSPELLVSHR